MSLKIILIDVEHLAEVSCSLVSFSDLCVGTGLIQSQEGVAQMEIKYQHLKDYRFYTTLELALIR